MSRIEDFMIDFTIPVEGIRRAESSFNTAAAKIVQAPLAAADQAGGDTVDLSAEMVALMESRNQFAANLKTLQVGDRMAQATLDILA